MMETILCAELCNLVQSYARPWTYEEVLNYLWYEADSCGWAFRAAEMSDDLVVAICRLPHQAEYHWCHIGMEEDDTLWATFDSSGIQDRYPICMRYDPSDKSSPFCDAEFYVDSIDLSRSTVHIWDDLYQSWIPSPVFFQRKGLPVNKRNGEG
jgi:hypothetical protein